MKHNRDKTRCGPNGRRRLEFGAPKVQLPLLNKAVYMDVKNSKQANLMEEQLKKLGARVEKFLSHEVNYVISSSGPLKAVDKASHHEENPQSPSFIASPFNSGPSPTGQLPSEPKSAAMVSRGKALAQIACAKNKASTVVTSAEKLGIKVISADVAVKWLEKEMKKIKCTKEDIMKETKLKEEVTQKENKYKKKLLKGPFIKFEDNGRHYRPVKVELEKWPRLNLSAPPGICPFGESKVKVQHHFGARAQQTQTNEAAAASRMGDGVTIQNVSRLEQEVLRRAEPTIVPDLVGVPLVPTADNRCILNFKKVFVNKQQGYCDCCCVKFQNMREHIAGEQHRSFARQKSNYERLDVVIGQIQSTASFLQSVLVKHCIQKQVEPTTTSATTENFNLRKSMSPSKTGKLDRQQEPVIQSIKTPDPSGQDVFTTKDYLANTENTDCMAKHDGSPNTKKTTNVCPPAVVIRRPQPSGLFVSPSRRQPTPSKKPRIQERSMIFRDSPMASLQPSPSCGSQNVSGFLSDSNLDVTYNKVAMSGHSMRRLVNIFDARTTKQNEEIREIKNAFSTLFSKNGIHLSNRLETTNQTEHVEGCEKQLSERNNNFIADRHRSSFSEQKDRSVKEVVKDSAEELKVNKNVAGLNADSNVTGVHERLLELPNNQLQEKLAANEKTKKLSEKLNCFVLLRDTFESSKKSHFSKNYVGADVCLGSASVTSQLTGAGFFRHKSKTVDILASKNNDKTAGNQAMTEKLHRVCNRKSPAIKTNLEATLEPLCSQSRIARFGVSGVKDGQVNTPSNGRISRVERQRVSGRVTRESVKKCLFQEAVQLSHSDMSASKSQELKLRNEVETFCELSVAASNLGSGDGGGSVDSKNLEVLHKSRTLNCKKIELIQKNKFKEIHGDASRYNSCAISQSNSVDNATEIVQVKGLIGRGTNVSAISSAGKGVLEDVAVNVSPSVNTFQISQQDPVTNIKVVLEEACIDKHVTLEAEVKNVCENNEVSVSPCVNSSVEITNQNEEKSVVGIDEGILSNLNMCVRVSQADPAKDIEQIFSTVNSETIGAANQSIFENLKMCDSTNANSSVHVAQPDLLINNTGYLQENSRTNCEIELAGLGAKKSTLEVIEKGVSSDANTCMELLTRSPDPVRSTGKTVQLTDCGSHTSCGSHETNNIAFAVVETELCEEVGVNAAEDLNIKVKMSPADSTMKPAEVVKNFMDVDCDTSHTTCAVAAKDSFRDPVSSYSDTSVQMLPSDLTVDAALVLTETAETMIKNAGSVHITSNDNHAVSPETYLPVHKDVLEEVHVNIFSDSNTSGNISPIDLITNAGEAVQVCLGVKSGEIQASTVTAEEGSLDVGMDTALDLNTSVIISPPVGVNITLDLNTNVKIKLQNSIIETAETMQDSGTPVASPTSYAVIEDVCEDVVVSVFSGVNTALQTKQQVSVLGTTELLQVTGVVNLDEDGIKDLKMDSCRNEVETYGENQVINKRDILSVPICIDDPEINMNNKLVISTAINTSDTKDSENVWDYVGIIKDALVGKIRSDNEVKSSDNLEHYSELRKTDNFQTECLSQSNEVKIIDSLDYQICDDKNEVNKTILNPEIGKESIEVTTVGCVCGSSNDIKKAKSTFFLTGCITSENNIDKIIYNEEVQVFCENKEVKTGNKSWGQAANENNSDVSDVCGAYMCSVDTKVCIGDCKNEVEPRDILNNEVCVEIQDSNVERPVDSECLVSEKYLEVVIPQHVHTESSEATHTENLLYNDSSLSQVLDCAANTLNVDHSLSGADVELFISVENSLEPVILDPGNAEGDEVSHLVSLPCNNLSLNQVLSSAASNVISDHNLPVNAENGEQLTSKKVLQANQGENQEDVEFEEKFDLSFLNLRKTAEMETELYDSEDTIIYGLNMDETLFDEVLTAGEVGNNPLMVSAEDFSCMRVPEAIIQESQLRPEFDSLLEDLKQEINLDEVNTAVAGDTTIVTFDECHSLKVAGHSGGPHECVADTHMSDQEVIFPAVKDEQMEDFYNTNLGMLAMPKEEYFVSGGIDSFQVNEHKYFINESFEGETLPSVMEDGLELVVVPNIADRVKSRSRITSSLLQPIISDSKAEKDNNRRRAKKGRRIVYLNHDLGRVKSKGVKGQETWVNNTGLIAARRRDRSIAVNRYNRSIAIKRHNRSIAAKRKHPSVHSVKLYKKQSNQSPDFLTVPNIAENVKKRRSCTMFNHKGQYANNGEGPESEILNEVSMGLTGFRSRAKINVHSAEKGLIRRVNSITDYDDITERSGSTDSYKQVKRRAINLTSTDCSSSSLIKCATESTPKTMELVRAEDELSDTSTAVVIRRRKSAIFPETLSSRSRKPEVDWALCQDEEDPISQSESCGDKTMTEPAFCEKNQIPTAPSPANPSMINSRRLSQPHQLNTDSKMLSTALTNFVTHMGDSENVKLLSKSSNNSPRLTEKTHPLASCGDSPLAKFSVSSPGLSKCSVMSPGVRRCLASSPGLSCSPRLRLKIKKEPDDKGYSSTLEEIHNCICVNSVVSKDSCQSFARQKNEENYIRIFHSGEFSGVQKAASVCSLATDGCQHHSTNQMFSSPTRSCFSKQIQHFSTPDNSDAVLFLESPMEIKTPEGKTGRRSEKAAKYISDSPVSSKKMPDHLNLSPVYREQSPLFAKFIPTMESDSSDATILQPPSPCFSSPISNFLKSCSTPSKSRVRDRSPHRSQSPVFSLTRMNLKILQNSQCSPPDLQKRQRTTPGPPLDKTCTDQLQLPTLHTAGLEATVRVAKLTSSLPVFNTSSHSVNPSKQPHHHTDQKLPSAKRIKTKNNSNLAHLGPPQSLNSAPSPAITTHVSSESNFSNSRLSEACELLPVICDKVLPSALTYNSTTEVRSKRAANISDQQDYILDHDAADWSETKLKDHLVRPQRPWTDTSGSYLTDSINEPLDRRNSHCSSKGGESTSHSFRLTASGQSVSRPNKRSLCVELDTAAEVNILRKQKRRKTESGVSTCVR